LHGTRLRAPFAGWDLAAHDTSFSRSSLGSTLAQSCGLLGQTYDEPVRRRAGLALVTMAAVGVVGGLAGCSGDDGTVVETGSVGRQTVVERVEAPANVAAAASATVSAPATGTVSRVAVKDGERVRRGEILLVVDSPQAQQQLAQAQQAAASVPPPVDLPSADTGQGAQQAAEAAARAFAQARSAARQIQDRDQRNLALQQIAAAEAQLRAAQSQAQSTVDQINSSVAALEQSLSAVTQAQSAQAAAAVQAARRTVRDLTVRAPISGTVVFGASAGGSDGGDVSSLVDGLPSDLAGQAQSLLGGGSSSGGSSSGVVSVGSPVSDGDPILTLTDTSQLSLTAQVDETDVLLVDRGVRADVELDAVPGATYAGRVINVDLSPTTSSRGGVSYVVRMSLGGGTQASGDPAPTPRPGMSAVASLRVLTAKDAVAVPVAAVFRDGERDAVWVVEDNTPTKRYVTLGAQGEDYLEVVDGVSVGDTIVTRGADQVVEGEPLP
jgi:multidrug efflux pump subunit AcrA (membrane-fusion protein)